MDGLIKIKRTNLRKAYTFAMSDIPSRVTAKHVFDNLKNYVICGLFIVLPMRFWESPLPEKISIPPKNFDLVMYKLMTIHAWVVFVILASWLLLINVLQTFGIFWRLLAEPEPEPLDVKVPSNAGIVGGIVAIIIAMAMFFAIPQFVKLN